MASTFLELHSKYEDLFSVTSINGVCIQITTKIDENSKLDLDVAYQPTELVTIMSQNGPQLAYAHPLRSFQIAGSTKYSIFDFSALYASNFQVATIKAKPTNALSCNMKLFKRPKTIIIPTFSAQLCYPKVAITSQAQSVDWKSFNSVDFTLSLYNRIGFQVVHRKDLPIGYAVLANYDYSKSSFSAAISHDQDKTFFILRSKTNVKDNMRAGVKFQIDQKMNSVIALAYRTKIKDTLVHGVVDSKGVVQSYFDHKVNDVFHFIVTSSLDHPESNYHFGIGLSWAPSEKE